MAWNDGLAGKQLDAAGHVGSPARLLAGPGTGKTFVMTRRICRLIEARGIAPAEIRAITFNPCGCPRITPACARGGGRRPPTKDLHVAFLRAPAASEE